MNHCASRLMTWPLASAFRTVIVTIELEPLYKTMCTNINIFGNHSHALYRLHTCDESSSSGHFADKIGSLFELHE